MWQRWGPGSSHLLIQCSFSITFLFHFLLTDWTLWSPLCLECQWGQTYQMFSEHILFMIHEIRMFMLCDSWFPGSLALVLVHVGIHCVVLFCGFFVVVLIWPVIFCHTWLDLITESLQIEMVSI